MKTIKFRAWHNIVKKYINPYLVSIDGYGNVERGGAMVNFITIEMFTVLHDKNGKEIYEGDITSGGEKIIFKDGSFRTTYFDDTTSGSILTAKRSKYIEIIGNIHENPELLQR